MNRGTRRVRALFATLTLCSLAALMMLLTGCSPCPAMPVGCGPLPAADR